MLSLLECTIQNLKLVQRKPKNQVWKQWWLLRRPWLDWKSWMISGWWQWWSCQWCIFMQLCWQSHQKRVIAAAREVICCFWSSFSNRYFVEPAIKVDDGERANEIKKKEMIPGCPWKELHRLYLWWRYAKAPTVKQSIIHRRLHHFPEHTTPFSRIWKVQEYFCWFVMPQNYTNAE